MSSRQAQVIEAIAFFCHEVRAKVQPPRNQYPEAQVVAPLERLLRDLGRFSGLMVRPFNEQRIPDLAIRPDFGVDVNGVNAGYVELKAPGKGVPATWRSPSAHDRKQWERLRRLPNVLYTDSHEWALYRLGDLRGTVVRLDRERISHGATEVNDLILDFLSWEPVSPRTVDQMVRITADLCRLLRDEVDEAIRQRPRSDHYNPMAERAEDWRRLLFPRLDGKGFADAYAQTVTFALLLARQEGVDFGDGDVQRIARLLGKKHLLLGKALDVLTSDQSQTGVAVDLLVRVIRPVDWSIFPPDTFIDLYERFLERYDPILRKKSGSYYTPAPLVQFMTRFVDDVLVHRMGRPDGLSGRDVFIVDPAMGTGSFLESVVRLVARSVGKHYGAGSVPMRLRSLAARLAGFEKQAAPYAVAELRIHAVFRAIGVDVPEDEARFLADTLDDPSLMTLDLGSFYEAIGRSRKGANRVKLEQPVMIVIGNPPYARQERSSGAATWITDRGGDPVMRPTLDAFRSPGQGRYEQRLHNLSTYFWRWATWKVFDAHPNEPAGVVALVTPAAYTTGPAFAGMREYLRRTADEGWIVDLSPEGFRPDLQTRVFEDTSQELCVSVFLRTGAPQVDTPAVVRRTSVSGPRQDKFDQLDRLTLSSRWEMCEDGWSAPFAAKHDERWASLPALNDVLPWSGPGMRANRTWVWSPDADALRHRWDTLAQAPDNEKAPLFKESHDAHLRKIAKPLPGFPPTNQPFISERGLCPNPVRMAFRAFDHQYLIPDARLLHRPSPAFWSVRSDLQVFVIEQHNEPVTAGPALLFTYEVPDFHVFNGRGGRALPLFRDGTGRRPNIASGLLEHLGGRLDIPVTPADLLAYIAAIAANPAFTRTFRTALSREGAVRVPITLETATWKRAVELGQRVLWLHTNGQRSARTWPADAPRLPESRRPRIISAIVDSAGETPHGIDHDGGTVLLVGRGQIAPVPKAVWEYEVSGWRVVRRWFSYRGTRPTSRKDSELDGIRPSWTDATEEQLLDLLYVLALCVDLEPAQGTLLDAVLGGPLLSVEELETYNVLPVSPRARKPPPAILQPGLWDEDDDSA